ncbi:MAG: low affinity iron permease family protein [Actinomycetota bacterium]|nr:low affinity iron permease family protein [Actinomycetota bacterium]
MTEQSDRPAASNRQAPSGSRRSPFERFVEAAHVWVTRPSFFFGCLAVVLVWLVSVPLWADLKAWQTAIHTVTSVITLLLLALLENASRRAEQASQEKLNVIAEALAALMSSGAAGDHDLQEAVTNLREAVGLEERH